MSIATLEPLYADILPLECLETILDCHRIPTIYWAEMRALVYDGIRPSDGLRCRLNHVGNYAGALAAITHELSKQCLFKFPPRRSKTAR